MRLALLCRGFGARGSGGMEAHAGWLAETMTSRGHQVKLITAVSVASAPDGYGIAVVDAPADRITRAWYQQARRATRAFAPDLVVGESTMGSFLVDEWPLVSHLHGNHWTELSGVWWTYGRRRTRHAVKRTAYIASDYIRWGCRRIGQGSVVALTAREARWARTLYGASADDIITIGNPVASSFFSMTPQAKRRSIVFAGRIDPSKGVDVLIDAYARSRTARASMPLEIAGDGPAREALIARVASLGLAERVIFHGRLPRQELAELLGGAAIVCAPSIRPEAFSLSLLEAMAAGCAVIASRNARVADIVDHPMASPVAGPAATVIDGFAPEQWSAAIDRAASSDALRASLGAAAQSVASSFAEQRVADRIEAVYQTAIARP